MTDLKTVPAAVKYSESACFLVHKQQFAALTRLRVCISYPQHSQQIISETKETSTLGSLASLCNSTEHLVTVQDAVVTGHFPPVRQCRRQKSQSEVSASTEWMEVENRNFSLGSLGFRRIEAKMNQR